MRAAVVMSAVWVDCERVGVRRSHVLGDVRACIAIRSLLAERLPRLLVCCQAWC